MVLFAGKTSMPERFVYTLVQKRAVEILFLSFSFHQTWRSVNRCHSWVDSAFYPLWDGKISTSQRAMMFCGWGVKAGMLYTTRG